MRACLLAATLAVGLACGMWAYGPGLQSGFVFDDLYNLNALGTFGPIRHFDSLLLYITSGNADPFGRPLSLLSFLIDANDWPADPLPFKQTNILLHLLNGVLLIWVLLRLGRSQKFDETRASAAALLGGGLWLLHPLWVSTTLYVVQREAMLPATCTMVGFLLWIEGRERFLAKAPGAVPRMIAAAWVLPVLGALCKANGLLLPLLLLVAEFSLLADQLPDEAGRRRRFRQLQLLLPGLPAGIVLLAVLGQLASFSAVPYESRGWTGYQHLITEARVLLDYLQQLFVPRATIAGLFNDSYPVSTDLLHPLSTLAAVLAVLALWFTAVGLRRRLPTLSFAILFFLASHLLESSVWPLELYFEHRNYLAAMPMFWPFAILLFTPPVSRWLALAISTALLAVLTALTHQRAMIWGQPLEQARLMMADPRLDSPRATIIAANDAIDTGRAPIAAHWLRQSLWRHADDLPLALTLITADCAGGDLPDEDLARTTQAISTDRRHLNASAVWFDHGMAIARAGDCPGFDWNTLDRLFRSARQNPGFATQEDYRRAYWHATGEAALAQGHEAEALDDFNAALLNRRDYDILLSQLALLGESGQPRLALAHLDYFNTLTETVVAPPGMPRLHQWLLERSSYWGSGLGRITAQLREDARTLPQPPASTH